MSKYLEACVKNTSQYLRGERKTLPFMSGQVLERNGEVSAFLSRMEQEGFYSSSWYPWNFFHGDIRNRFFTEDEVIEQLTKIFRQKMPFAGYVSYDTIALAAGNFSNYERFSCFVWRAAKAAGLVPVASTYTPSSKWEKILAWGDPQKMLAAEHHHAEARAAHEEKEILDRHNKPKLFHERACAAFAADNAYDVVFVPDKDGVGSYVGVVRKPDGDFEVRAWRAFAMLVSAGRSGAMFGFRPKTRYACGDSEQCKYGVSRADFDVFVASHRDGCSLEAARDYIKSGGTFKQYRPLEMSDDDGE